MKKLLIACSLALATTSCKSIPDPAVLCSPSFVMDSKAMAGAEILYNVPAHAYDRLNRAGKLSQATKNSVKPKLLMMFDHLDKAYTFYNAKDATGFGAHVSQLCSLSSETKSELGVG